MTPGRVMLLRLLGAVLMGTSAIMVARYDMPREYLWFILAAWGGFAIGKVDDQPWVIRPEPARKRRTTV